MKNITLKIDNSELLKLLFKSIGNGHALSVTKNARLKMEEEKNLWLEPFTPLE